jgi:predicted DCC family thiol-disulfide oxidoreductase YuxK
VSAFPEFVAQLDGRLLVVFDGHCGFCNRSVRWLLRRDSRDRLRFAPSSHPAIASLLSSHRFTDPDTLLVFLSAGASPLTRSSATLACLRQLPGPWPALAAFSSLIPRPLRDLGYRFIARVRYRVWGRYDVCPIPTEAERSHFL